MKKLLAMSLVVVMVFAMVAPMTVSASYTPEEEILYSNDFSSVFGADDPNVPGLSGWTGYIYHEGEDIDGSGFAQGIINDNLMVHAPGAGNLYNDSTGARLGLYDIPENVSSFTVEFEYTVLGDFSDTRSGLGLIFSDNGVTGKDEKTPEDVKFDLVYARGGNVGGYCKLGGGDHKGTGSPYPTIGLWGDSSYIIRIHVPDTSNHSDLQCTYEVVEKATNTVWTSSAGSKFPYHVSGNEKPTIGVYVYGTDVILENIVVTGVKAPVKEEVLYFNDFSSIFGADDPNVPGLSGWTGYIYHEGKDIYGSGFGQATYNGDLKVNAPGYPNLYNDSTGARLGLYDIPNDVTSFTVEFEYRVADPFFDTRSGLGLIFSDNGVTGKDEKTPEDVKFDLVYARSGNVGGYCKLGGGDHKGTGSPYNTIGLWGESSYIIRIHVPDTSNHSDLQCTYEVVEKATNTVWTSSVGSKFPYHVSGNEKPTIGVYVYGTSVILENIVVTGVRATTPGFAGTSVTAGEDYSINFVANTPAGAAATDLTTDFTFNGNTVSVAGVDAGAGKAAFTFDGVAPQAMGDTIKAELKYNGEVIDTKEYSVADNLKAIAENAEGKYSATDVAFAQASLVYGAAAQKYKGYNTNALVGDTHGLSVLTAPDVADHTLSNGTAAKFTTAGLNFDYANKAYFRFTATDIANTKAYIGEDEVEIVDCEDGTYKVYSDYITAKELKGASFTVTLKVGGEVESTLTYSVYNYVENMWGDAEIGDLVKALYDYAEKAAAYNA